MHLPVVRTGRAGRVGACRPCAARPAPSSRRTRVGVLWPAARAASGGRDRKDAGGRDHEVPGVDHQRKQDEALGAGQLGLHGQAPEGAGWRGLVGGYAGVPHSAGVCRAAFAQGGRQRAPQAQRPAAAHASGLSTRRRQRQNQKQQLAGSLQHPPAWPRPHPCAAGCRQAGWPPGAGSGGRRSGWLARYSTCLLGHGPAQDHAGDDFRRDRLKQVGAARGAVAHVVAHQVRNHRRVPAARKEGRERRKGVREAITAGFLRRGKGGRIKRKGGEGSYGRGVPAGQRHAPMLQSGMRRYAQKGAA